MISMTSGGRAADCLCLVAAICFPFNVANGLQFSLKLSPILSYTLLYSPILSYSLLYSPIPSYTLLYQPILAYMRCYILLQQTNQLYSRKRIIHIGQHPSLTLPLLLAASHSLFLFLSSESSDHSATRLCKKRLSFSTAINCLHLH